MSKLFALSMIGVHNFRKVNAATRIDERGQYDLMKCTDCGLEGKCRDLQSVQVERMTKKATYCTMSDTEIKKRGASSEYNGGIKTKHKCPDCKNILSEVAIWIDEDTDDILAEMVCLCGHKEYIDVTERERKKKKEPTSKRFKQLFEESRKPKNKYLKK